MSYDPIAAAHARNVASKKARAACVPEVGIWWLINGQLIVDSIPYTEAPEHAGFREGNRGHYDVFATLQRIMPPLRRLEYTDFPRGRALYDASSEQFLCYGSKQFASSTEQQQLVLDAFRLPFDRTRFIPDLHYEDPNAAIFG